MTGRASRRKGADAERGIVAWLRARGHHVERRLSGGPADTGDITGWPGVCIEAKSCARLELAAWLDQLEAEIAEADADTGVVVVKRRGTTDVGQWYALLPVERWHALMREAGR